MSQASPIEAGLTRRNALRTGSWLVAGGLAGGCAGSAAFGQEPKTGPDVSAAAIPVGRNFPKAMWDQEPWTFALKGPYDLADPVGRWAALIKSTQNLVGARTYVSSYSRVFLTEVGKEPHIFYGTCGSWTYQLVKPKPGQFPKFEPFPENTALQLGLYTGVTLDPHTFEPVDEIRNPITGEMLKPVDSIFAESYLIYPGGGMTSVERSEFLDDRKPKMHSYLRSGNDLSWAIPALFQGKGSFQPRMDSSWWSCRYDELMNPAMDLIDCAYSWVGQTRAAEKPWWGMQGRNDGIYGTLWNTYGTVTNKLEKVEGIVLEHVFSKYPDRV